MTIRIFAAALAAAAFCFAANSAPAAAQITVSGSAELPASGLRVSLPRDTGRTYKLSAAFWLEEEDGYFDGRDTIDEFNAAGYLVAGNRVQIGYFNAGGCEPLLKGLPLGASQAITSAGFWGHTWQVRYGVQDFEGTLGKRPAAALCSINADGRAILLHRFLTDQPETTPQSAIVEAVRSAQVLQNAWSAYEQQVTIAIKPVGRPEVSARGTTPATRTRVLPISNIEVTFPNDGYLWYVDDDAEEYDLIDRLLPTLPEISFEVLAVSGMTCAEVFKDIKDEAPAQKMRNLPAGWLSGPTLLVDGDTQFSLCAKTSYGSVAAGVYMPPRVTDAVEIVPLLNALAAAPLQK